MKIVPLAAESMGVRSMATYVEAGGARLLIDPGATLAPSRFNLPPSDEEWEAFRRANDRISAYAARADRIFVSHYHDDHFRSAPPTYAGRTVLLKDPRRMVGGLQARRAGELWRVLAPHAKVESADDRVIAMGDVEVRVSPPLAHGLEGTPLGYVLALTVIDAAERERFVFGSDVQGPLSPVAAAYLVRMRPTLLYLSGPPSYIEHELGAAVVDRGIANLLRVIEATSCRVIMDHHALRDSRAGERFARLWDTGRVVTAAGYLGLPDRFLESRRRDAWTAARKPPAEVARPARGATMTGARVRRAKGGRFE